MDLFVKLDMVGYMFVLKILFGNVYLFGVFIDYLEWDEIIGIICGDDICLIICCIFDDIGVVFDCFLNML